jgi:hypothetical protein
MINETGKHYIYLDNPEYTCYPDEKEILLQAGLILQVKDFVEHEGLHVIHLVSSEKMVRRHKLYLDLLFFVPLLKLWIECIVTMICGKVLSTD